MPILEAPRPQDEVLAGHKIKEVYGGRHGITTIVLGALKYVYISYANLATSRA